MQINFSTASRIAYLVVAGIFLRALIAITYGWSFGETEEFSLLIATPQYAWWLAVAIQVGQQPVLILRELIKDPRVKRILTGLFFLLAGVDALSNIAAFIQWYSMADKTSYMPFVVTAAYITGLIVCIAVVFADEFAIWMLGGMFYLLGLILADFGVRTPKWFNLKGAVKATQAASGASAFGVPSPDELGGSSSGRGGGQPRGDEWAGRGGSGGRQHATS